MQNTRAVILLSQFDLQGFTMIKKRENIVPTHKKKLKLKKITGLLVVLEIFPRFMNDALEIKYQIFLNACFPSISSVFSKATVNITANHLR